MLLLYIEKLGIFIRGPVNLKGWPMARYTRFEYFQHFIFPIKYFYKVVYDPISL